MDVLIDYVDDAGEVIRSETVTATYEEMLAGVVLVPARPGVRHLVHVDLIAPKPRVTVREVPA